MSEFIKVYMPEIIAGLALLLSLSANLIAEKACRTSEKYSERGDNISKAEKRTESLVEIELQNVAVGNMLFVMARKIMLFHKYPDFDNMYPGEYERLSNNLDLMKDLQAKNNYQRQVSEAALEGDSIVLHEKALAEVRRLRVSLENEVQKEAQILEEMLYELRGV